MTTADDLERSLQITEQHASDRARARIALNVTGARDRLLAAAKQADREEYRRLHRLLLMALAATDDAAEAVSD